MCSELDLVRAEDFDGVHREPGSPNPDVLPDVMLGILPNSRPSCCAHARLAHARGRYTRSSRKANKSPEPENDIEKRKRKTKNPRVTAGLRRRHHLHARPRLIWNRHEPLCGNRSNLADRFLTSAENRFPGVIWAGLRAAWCRRPTAKLRFSLLASKFTRVLVLNVASMGSSGKCSLIRIKKF